jgi:hypothetical protein
VISAQWSGVGSGDGRGRRQIQYRATLFFEGTTIRSETCIRHMCSQREHYAPLRCFDVLPALTLTLTLMDSAETADTRNQRGRIKVVYSRGMDTQRHGDEKSMVQTGLTSFDIPLSMSCDR